ncbi:Ubiquitin carboxyl-terminal hydrolase CYLD [Fragariocoptes setiger]|uniref:ubiquitinyl hydrolase 1 n=1 Tax=Fragariocoptes setiger TaxID=1670756 RepID=A0ABQ7SAS3_9ACAR|nr:Ubiquitin carboxyl-terminal hydrolase CYLD [Fragariocoptes setiger]
MDSRSLSSTVPSLSMNERIVWISDNGPEYGYVRWLGKLPDIGDDWMVGVEFDNPVGTGTGFYRDQQLFESQMNHASLVPIIGLMKAADFEDSSPTSSGSQHNILTYPAPKTLRSLMGKSRGIQGHNNSCYLDATLFAMFSSATVFESLLYRPSTAKDIPEYSQVQNILREEIVRPLRKDFFVSANQVMQLRTLLEKLSSVEGLTDEEKDPEEFLTLLLNQILRAEPYLKLSSGLESFFYQLIVDKDENIVLPTVQDLFDQSCLGNSIRLREIPPCLLLQMPRFGRQYKMYSRIVPSMQLDITDILESSPRACGQINKNCDNLASFECKDCFGERGNRFNTRLSNITYCKSCFQSKHFSRSHSTGIEDHDNTKSIIKHGCTNREAQQRFLASSSSSKNKTIPRVYMDLFAILCIETSHYVCFVKCDNDPDAPWCFFDSMADRKGEQNGYNIPEVSLFEDLPFWLSDKGIAYLLNNRDDKLLPEMSRRLICDAYMCFYQSSDLQLYR